MKRLILLISLLAGPVFSACSGNASAPVTPPEEMPSDTDTDDEPPFYGGELRADGNSAGTYDLILRNGMPMIKSNSSAERKCIGNIQPDLLMSITPSFSYKGFFLSAMLDMRFGGDIVSVSEAIAIRYGTAKRTEYRPATGIILDGIDEATGLKNTVAVPAEDYYRSIGGDNAPAEEFVYDASYIKFKELSIGYSFPSKWLQKIHISNLRLAFVGRNLCYLLKHTPGTSPEGGYDTTMFSQAIDYTAVPYTRTFGFSINVGF